MIVWNVKINRGLISESILQILIAEPAPSFFKKNNNQQTNSTIRCNKAYPRFVWLVYLDLFLFARRHTTSPQHETPSPFKRKT